MGQIENLSTVVGRVIIALLLLMKNVALAGGLMFIAGRGAGAFSLDGRTASAD